MFLSILMILTSFRVPSIVQASVEKILSSKDTSKKLGRWCIFHRLFEEILTDSRLIWRIILTKSGLILSVQYRAIRSALLFPSKLLHGTFGRFCRILVSWAHIWFLSHLGSDFYASYSLTVLSQSSVIYRRSSDPAHASIFESSVNLFRWYYCVVYHFSYVTNDRGIGSLISECDLKIFKAVGAGAPL